MIKKTRWALWAVGVNHDFSKYSSSSSQISTLIARQSPSLCVCLTYSGCSMLSVSLHFCRCNRIQRTPLTHLRASYVRLGTTAKQTKQNEDERGTQELDKRCMGCGGGPTQLLANREPRKATESKLWR